MEVGMESDEDSIPTLSLLSEYFHKTLHWRNVRSWFENVIVNTVR